MSIDTSGRDFKLETTAVTIVVPNDHKLIKLANNLPWNAMMDIVCIDLKDTTAKGMWHLGRSIVVRIHLAIFLLQKIYDLTDRGIIDRLKSDAAFQTKVQS